MTILSSPIGAVGVDVSQWQGSLDWATARAAGVEFAVVKVGHTFGRPDPGLVRHRDAARAAGVKVGFYWYGYGGTDPKREAANFVAWSGRRQGEPMFLDAEHDSLTQAWVSAFLAEVDRLLGGGVRCHVYTYWSFLNERPWLDSCIGNRALWLAVYNSRTVPTTRQGAPRGMAPSGHQFTSTMLVPGYGDRLDVNLWYGGVTKFTALGGAVAAPTNNTTPVARVGLAKPAVIRCPLAKGMTGDDVRWVQHELNRVFYWYSKLVEDGSYGDKTAAVVAEFQRKAKADGEYPGAVDGEAGPLTQRVMRAYHLSL